MHLGLGPSGWVTQSTPRDSRSMDQGPMVAMPKRDMARRDPSSKWSPVTSVEFCCLATKIAKLAARSVSFIQRKTISDNIILSSYICQALILSTVAIATVEDASFVDFKWLMGVATVALRRSPAERDHNGP